MTTAFREDLSVDHEFVGRHASWMIDQGCTGIVALVALGEGATLTEAEKSAILKTCVSALGKRAPVVAGVSALSTAEGGADRQGRRGSGLPGADGVAAVRLLDRLAGDEGAHRRGPAGDASFLHAVQKPARVQDGFTPPQIAELASELPSLHAVKESSADLRRVTAMRALIGNRLRILVSVDDLIVEGVGAGADGWIAGLVNALPKESVAIFEAAKRGFDAETFRRYAWFLPLLRLDVVPKFVQMIKLTQAAVGMGNARVRPPRLELVGDELRETQAVIQTALANRAAIWK